MDAKQKQQEYPKRPKFFAYRLTRMMFKTAIANDIGAEACHLIIQIAHTEDAARYLKPVTFYNEQLLPVCGFTNVKALDRARAKAVKSGWLVYLPGGKGKAGKYWTQIPSQYESLDDTPIDESNSSSELEATQEDTTYLPATGKETGEKREINARQTGDKREANGRQTPEKWATITSIPIPNPEIHTHTPGESENKKSPMAESFPAADAAIVCVEVNGHLLHYDDDWSQWEARFIEMWNAAIGNAKHIGGCLSAPHRSLLKARFGDPGWFWKRALAKFPLWSDTGWTPGLTWFLEEKSVQNILEGRYDQRRTTPKQTGLFGGGKGEDPTRVRTGEGADLAEAAAAKAAAKRLQQRQMGQGSN